MSNEPKSIGTEAAEKLWETGRLSPYTPADTLGTSEQIKSVASIIDKIVRERGEKQQPWIAKPEFKESDDGFWQIWCGDKVIARWLKKKSALEIVAAHNASLSAAKKDLGSETPPATGVNVSEQTGLVPCPFCGSSNLNDKEGSIECLACGAMGPCEPYRDSPLWWNKRVPQTPVRSTKSTDAGEKRKPFGHAFTCQCDKCKAVDLRHSVAPPESADNRGA